MAEPDTREPLRERLLDLAGDVFQWTYLALMFSLPVLALGLIVFGIVEIAVHA